MDYLGIFDDVAQALKFDEKGVQKAVSNIAELMAILPTAIQKCIRILRRSRPGPTRLYEGLIAAQDCLPTDEMRDAFASDFSVLSRIWEALSPDPVLASYEKDYRWLAQVSGGTMERPALKGLLQDIRQKRVDVVVVYKIDRYHAR